MDDLAEFKPTILMIVPRLLNRIYAEFNATINAKTGIVKSLIDSFYNKETVKYNKTGNCAHDCFSSMFFGNLIPLKGKLGGRVEFMLTGSAPIKPEVMDFLKASLGINVVEGYGMTENAASHCTTKIDDTSSGHVGYQNYNNIMRLKDHVELGYTSDNIPENQINGLRVWKGEICFKGGCTFLKQFNNPEANEESFENGWFRTGDVGMIDE